MASRTLAKIVSLRSGETGVKETSSRLSLDTGINPVLFLASNTGLMAQYTVDDDVPPLIYDISPKPFSQISNTVAGIQFKAQDEKTSVVTSTFNVIIDGVTYVSGGVGINGATFTVSTNIWGGVDAVLALPSFIAPPVTAEIRVSDEAGNTATKKWWYGATTHGPYSTIDLNYTVVDEILAVQDVTVVVLDGGSVKPVEG